MERDDLTSCSYVMVELSTRKREIRGVGGNHHQTLGLKRILCTSQFTIADRAGMSADPGGNITETRSSKPNQASSTPDFSYLLVSSILFLSWSPMSLFLVLNSAIITRTQSQVILLYLSVPSSWVDTECSIHWVQHTVSAAYTKCSIHPVQHTPSAANSECSIHRVLHKHRIVCRLFHSEDLELTPKCRFSFQRTPPQINRH